MHSYLTTRLARQLHRERQAEYRQARAAALTTASRRRQRAPERRVRRVWWLRSEPER